MKPISTIDTLAFKIWGMIESPPIKNRANFRQGVLDAIVRVLATQNATIEFIGYKPDQHGAHQLDAMRTIYEDCIFLSLSLQQDRISQFESTSDLIINEFISVFESSTGRHLAVDSTVINQMKSQKCIEMTSDWKLYLKQG